MPILRTRVRGDDDGRIAIAAEGKEGALSAVTKWVPIEVIAFYEGVTTPFADQIAPYLLELMVVGLIVTFLWIAFATETAQAASRIAWRQVVLSCIAFFFWIVGTSSPDIWKLHFGWWHPGFGPAALAAGAILLPIADGIMKRLGIRQD
ncbi:hypothetical protein AB7M17_006024 [Bradyrhizobium sp. USDA 377]